MARARRIRRPLIAEAVRAVTSVALVAGTALLLARPKATSGRTGRGQFSHHPSAQAIGEGFEVKDLSAKALAGTVASLGIGAACLVGIVFGMIWLFGSWDAERTARLTREQTTRLPPPGPRLQGDPIGDLDRARGAERLVLQAYGWADPGHTRARIPIGRAMAIVTGTSLDQAP